MSSSIEVKDEFFIPQYDEIYHEGLDRYHVDYRNEEMHSYEFKEERLVRQSRIFKN